MAIRNVKGSYPVPEDERTFRIWWWLIPVLWLATGLGSLWLYGDILWNDEWLSYFTAGAGKFDPIPVQNIFWNAVLDNGWPPAYFLMMALWDKFSGGHVLLDRLLALFVGLLGICFVYQLGRQLFSAKIGLVAALLLASSAFFAHYLHEIRAYSLYVMAVALSGWLYWLTLDTRYQERRWVRWGFALSVALSLYTHYIATASVLAIGLYHVLFERPADLRTPSEARKRWLMTLRFGINGCLLYAPWLAVLFISFFNETLNVRNTSLADLLQGMVVGFSNNLWWVVIPLLPLSLIAIRRRALRFLWVWMVVIVIFAIVGNIKADFLVHPRHVMGMLPALVLTLAFSLHLITQRYAILWVLLGVWVGAGMVLSLTPDFMNSIPGHVKAPPISMIDTVVEAAETCIAPDDSLFFALDDPDEEWKNDLPLGFYLSDYDFRYLGMSYALHEVRAPSLLLSKELNEASPSDRFDYMIEDAPIVWVFALKDEPLQYDLLTLDTRLNEAGYHPCPPVIDTPDVLGIGYSHDDAACTRILPCGE